MQAEQRLARHVGPKQLALQEVTSFRSLTYTSTKYQNFNKLAMPLFREKARSILLEQNHSIQEL